MAEDVVEENDPSLLRSFMDLEQDHWSFSDWRSPGRSADDEDTKRHSSDEEADNGARDNNASNEDGDGQQMEDPSDNQYIRRILNSADLHILRPGVVSNAYNSTERELSLLMLFFPNDYLTNVCGWTNEVLAKRGHSSCTVKEFFAYMGLELGMSLIKYNSIKKLLGKGLLPGT
jgi:hypothetical protein